MAKDCGLPMIGLERDFTVSTFGWTNSDSSIGEFLLLRKELNNLSI